MVWMRIESRVDKVKKNLETMKGRLNDMDSR